MAVTYCRAGETTGPITLTSTPGDFTTDTVVEVEGGDCAVAVTFVSVNTVTFTVTPRKDAATGDREIRIFELGNNAVPVVRTGIVSILARGCEGSLLYFFTKITGGSNKPSGAFDPDLPGNRLFEYDGTSTNAHAPRMYHWDKGDGATFPFWEPGNAATGPDLPATVESDVISGYLDGSNNLSSAWLDTITNYTCARGVGPDEYVAASGTVNAKKWLGFPDPTVNYRALLHPQESFFRRPFYYMGTPNYFWTRQALANATLNQDWKEQSRFVGFPLWYRSKNGATFNDNYGESFKLLRDYEHANNMFYDKNGVAECYAVLVLTVNLLELVPPGPRLNDEITGASDLRQKYSYRRWEHGSSLRAKIQVHLQDMWAFQDQMSGAPINPGSHQMAEPILIAEAFCPRIDLTYDYNYWDILLQVLPSHATNNGLAPTVTGESNPFKWTQVLKHADQAVIGNSTLPTIGAGTYLTPQKCVDVADLFMAEFSGLRCKMVLSNAMAWERATPVTGLPGSSENCFTGRSQALPTYNNAILDREGTWTNPLEGYLEVIK